jgi:hypothetical protein
MENQILWEAWLLIRGTERYLELLKDSKVKGYLFAQGNILPGQKE